MWRRLSCGQPTLDRSQRGSASSGRDLRRGLATRRGAKLLEAQPQRSEARDSFEPPDGFTLVDERRYGKAKIRFLRKDG